MANTLVLSYCDDKSIILTESQEWEIEMLIKSVGLVAAVIIFAVLFLFLVGERIESAILELQLKEKALQEEREQFIRSLSHDIRTPLTSILSYSDYMKEKEVKDEQKIKEYIGMMQRKAEQIRSLTDQLLDGGVRRTEMIESGKTLMQQLTEDWLNALENKFNCEIDLKKCPDFTGEFDVREMCRVFDNLVSNVEKYADVSEIVRLEITQEKEKLVIRQENMIKNTLENVESRGIGITSIRKIVENYDGDVLVTVDENKFSIEIFFRIL